MSGESLLVWVESTDTLYWTSGPSLSGNCVILLGVKRDAMALNAGHIMLG